MHASRLARLIMLDLITVIIYAEGYKLCNFLDLMLLITQRFISLQHFVHHVLLWNFKSLCSQSCSQDFPRICSGYTLQVLVFDIVQGSYWVLASEYCLQTRSSFSLL